jgi:hypothetical protein
LTCDRIQRFWSNVPHAGRKKGLQQVLVTAGLKSVAEDLERVAGGFTALSAEVNLRPETNGY